MWLCWFVLYFKKQKVILGTFEKEWLWGVLFPVRLSVEKKKKCAAEEGTDANESGYRLCRVHRVFSFLIQCELLLSFHAFKRVSFGLSACVSAKWASWVSLAVAIADEHRSHSPFRLCDVREEPADLRQNGCLCQLLRTDFSCCLVRL